MNGYLARRHWGACHPRRPDRLGHTPELEAKRCDGKIRAGNILLSVHTANSDEIKVAQKNLQGCWGAGHLRHRRGHCSQNALRCRKLIVASLIPTKSVVALSGVKANRPNFLGIKNAQPQWLGQNRAEGLLFLIF
jgi:hypothetical protein